MHQRSSHFICLLLDHCLLSVSLRHLQSKLNRAVASAWLPRVFFPHRVHYGSLLPRVRLKVVSHFHCRPCLFRTARAAVMDSSQCQTPCTFPCPPSRQHLVYYHQQSDVLHVRNGNIVPCLSSGIDSVWISLFTPLVGTHVQANLIDDVRLNVAAQNISSTSSAIVMCATSRPHFPERRTFVFLTSYSRSVRR